jgi:predicted O-methyltransferase YrrM
MSQAQWNAVDDYISDILLDQDAALTQALADSQAGGLPAISVSPAQGKFLHLMAKACRARSILEIGTLGGYSTIWLARALPADGRMVTLEAEPKHAKVAQANITRAGVGSKVDLRVGRAIDTLPKLAEDANTSFDFIFIDADKPSIPDYFTWSMKLVRPGSVIIIDNMVRGGALADAASSDAGVKALRRVNELMAAEPRVSATVVQTVGAKGYDGFSMAVVER